MFHEQESGRSKTNGDLTMDLALKFECLVILLRTLLKEGEERDGSVPDSWCLYESHDTSLEPA
jgi:hypothetical protein